MKSVIVIAIILLFLSACAADLKGKEPRPDIEIKGQQCSSIPPGRGLVMDFIADAPPKSLVKDDRFPVILKFANYNPDPINIELRVQDDSGTDTFSPQIKNLYIEGATYEKSRLQYPGCKIDNIPELNLGLFAYTLDANKNIRFIAKAFYDYTSMLSGSVCAYDVITGASSSCGGKETLTEGSLGPYAPYNPVSVVSIEKNLLGIEKSQVIMAWDIKIRNMLPNGLVKENLVNFRIDSEEIPINCRSVSSESAGSSLDLKLDEKGEASVRCESELFIDSVERYNFVIDLDYRYEYFAASQPIEYRMES